MVSPVYPIVPYLGLYLADVVYLRDGTPDFLDKEKKVINFEKMGALADLLYELEVLQQIPYKVDAVSGFHSYEVVKLYLLLFVFVFVFVALFVIVFIAIFVCIPWYVLFGGVSFSLFVCLCVCVCVFLFLISSQYLLTIALGFLLLTLINSCQRSWM